MKCKKSNTLCIFCKYCKRNKQGENFTGSIFTCEKNHYANRLGEIIKIHECDDFDFPESENPINANGKPFNNCSTVARCYTCKEWFFVDGIHDLYCEKCREEGTKYDNQVLANMSAKGITDLSGAVIENEFKRYKSAIVAMLKGKAKESTFHTIYEVEHWVESNHFEILATIETNSKKVLKAQREDAIDMYLEWLKKKLIPQVDETIALARAKMNEVHDGI